MRPEIHNLPIHDLACPSVAALNRRWQILLTLRNAQKRQRWKGRWGTLFGQSTTSSFDVIHIRGKS
eukprot:4053309-Alexandrium_andersonii.AAC.1